MMKISLKLCFEKRLMKNKMSHGAAHLQTIHAKQPTLDAVPRSLRIDDVTARAFVLREFSHVGLNFFKWKMFLTPYSFGILLIYK